MTNNPIVPKNVDQSQNDGLNMPHADGVKSRLRLAMARLKRALGETE